MISGIILKELQRGSFSLADFYFRRIVRIFPALLLVMTFTLAFGWLVLFPNEYEQLAKHTVGGALFASNIVLLREVGYFDPAAHSKPLLHLLSLGIEEQFLTVLFSLADPPSPVCGDGQNQSFPPYAYSHWFRSF